jgi:hypothetical protein
VLATRARRAVRQSDFACAMCGSTPRALESPGFGFGGQGKTKLSAQAGWGAHAIGGCSVGRARRLLWPWRSARSDVLHLAADRDGPELTPTFGATLAGAPQPLRALLRRVRELIDDRGRIGSGGE